MNIKVNRATQDLYLLIKVIVPAYVNYILVAKNESLVFKPIINYAVLSEP